MSVARMHPQARCRVCNTPLKIQQWSLNCVAGETLENSENPKNSIKIGHHLSSTMRISANPSF